MNENIIQVLTASLGAAGFGMLFNVHGKKLLWIAAGGGLGWLGSIAFVRKYLRV